MTFSTLLKATGTLALGGLLAACGSNSTSTTTTDQTAATASPAGSMSSSMSKAGDRFGGPSYKGAPNLAATAALVAAGGGAAKYSTATALTSMVGAPTLTKEVAKLDKQYGKARVAQFLKTFDFAVKDSLAVATKAGIKLPAPAPLKGKDLATALVKTGTTADGTFWTGWLLDHAVSNKIHNKVMDDIDAKYGATADADYHRISNQAHYDLGQALGDTTVKLASFH